MHKYVADIIQSAFAFLRLYIIRPIGETTNYDPTMIYFLFLGFVGSIAGIEILLGGAPAFLNDYIHQEERGSVGVNLIISGIFFMIFPYIVYKINNTIKLIISMLIFKYKDILSGCKKRSDNSVLSMAFLYDTTNSALMSASALLIIGAFILFFMNDDGLAVTMFCFSALLGFNTFLIYFRTINGYFGTNSDEALELIDFIISRKNRGSPPLRNPLILRTGEFCRLADRQG